MGNHTIRPGSEKDLETYRKKLWNFITELVFLLELWSGCYTPECY